MFGSLMDRKRLRSNGNVSKKKKNSTVENLTSHIIDLHVVDSQRSFLTDLHNTKYQKLLSLMSMSTESLKRQRISDTELFSSR